MHSLCGLFHYHDICIACVACLSFVARFNLCGLFSLCGSFLAWVFQWKRRQVLFSCNCNLNIFEIYYRVDIYSIKN